ncbi:major facilitator superfamily protein [Hirsutella rhossiliensis]|uniref:Major facilitator superfamily domain-containing protein n=1 Tax=Hirsutella rhossiliensis TaxID=111463 RepID=A0A9P8NC70_9HYPO|nr:major facilitator superfamily domain-containing protein [Hirsutella rhossiliensis]KAH0968472.1 major facilitator superfamily domain-containing protein [Hirsutella rhossiliensis]
MPRDGAQAGEPSWMSLPRKDQLVILFLCRLVDFLQVASLQAYVFHQVKSFNESVSDVRASQQVGLLQGCFAGAQVITAVLWGRAADASWCGRKRVLVIGLGGTALSCLGYAFATTLLWAACWRAFGGATNGTVGIIRTMIGEITKDSKHQSRAFLILPMSFNIAGIFGPVMGGLLADSVKTMPGLFGEYALLDCQWIRDYPYALPSLINCIFLTVVTVIVFLFVEETSNARRGEFDYGLQIGKRIKQAVLPATKSQDGYSYIPVQEDDHGMENLEQQAATAAEMPSPSRHPPFLKLWTTNVLFTLLTIALYDCHLGAFANIWPLALSTPRYLPFRPEDQGRDPANSSTGGLGMPASTVGLATSLLGIFGLLLQVTLYPPVQAWLGTMPSFRYFLVLFPVAYLAGSFLPTLPSSKAPPEPAAGVLVWIGIVLVLVLHVIARTFTLPASIVLLNNCSPHPSVLGTVHGLGQSVSAGFRTVGPVVGGYLYGYGLEIGFAACAMCMHEGG